jgi:hypothetical protein
MRRPAVPAQRAQAHPRHPLPCMPPSPQLDKKANQARAHQGRRQVVPHCELCCFFLWCALAVECHRCQGQSKATARGLECRREGLRVMSLPGGACAALRLGIKSDLCLELRSRYKIRSSEQSQETCLCTPCTPGALERCALPCLNISRVVACQAGLLRGAAASQASTLRLQLSGARSPEVAGAGCGAEPRTRVLHNSLPLRRGAQTLQAAGSVTGEAGRRRGAGRRRCVCALCPPTTSGQACA